MKPTVGRVVHYVAYGTPGGEYPAGAHRAAIVTTEGGPMPGSPTAWFVGLCILNPTGMFFAQQVMEDQTAQQPGTWHWPERE